ncbi:hypothetical protein ACVWZZ_007655 [Bradyrhizobium sp. LM6.10]
MPSSDAIRSCDFRLRRSAGDRRTEHEVMQTRWAPGEPHAAIETAQVQPAAGPAACIPSASLNRSVNSAPPPGRFSTATVAV